MHIKRASIAAALVGGTNAIEERSPNDAPAMIEHVFIGQYTSTVFSTSTSTVVACGTGVTNCPASDTGVLTSIVPAYVTICPYTSVSTETPSGASSGPPITLTITQTGPITPTASSSTSESFTSETTTADTTTHITSTKTVKITTIVTVSASASTPTVPSSSGSTSGSTSEETTGLESTTPIGFAPTYTSATVTTSASTNAIGPIGATGTGNLNPTNGTLTTQSVPPTSTFVPYEGSAQELKGGFAGLLIAAAAVLI